MVGQMTAWAVAGAAGVAVVLAAGTAGAVPAATGPPTIAGVVRFNDTITCRPGSWSGDPVSFSYEWLRGGSPFATGARLRFVDLTSMAGFDIACRVTATDAAGAAAAATSAAQRPQLGRMTLRLTRVTPLPRGRVRIRGVVGPKAVLTAPFGGTADFVVVSRPARGGVTQLGEPAKVDARGRFVLTVSDIPGRRAITVRYWSGHRDIWGGIDVRRTVRFTPGGGGGGGGTVAIGG